jgi:hypothetical protein
MHHRHIRWLTAAAAALFATHAAAQEVRWTGTVSTRGLQAVSGISDETPNVVPKDGKAVLTITCSPGARCAAVSATLVQTNRLTGTSRQGTIAPAHPNSSTAVFEIPGTDVLAADGNTDLRIALAGDTIGRFQLVHPGGAGNGDRRGGATVQGPNLAQLLARDCRSEVRSLPEPVYDERRNSANFIVTPVGNVLRRPAPVIDETDSVTVVVLADERLLPLLKVYRKSAIRTVGAVRFIGEGTDLAKVFRPQSERVDSLPAAPPMCRIASFVLRDFQPGKGEVEISALTGKMGDDDATEVVGGFEFNVNPLYSGAFSLGAMRTTLSAPVYGLTADGDDDIVSVRENGDFRVKYVLMYTHFIWGKRDVEKLPRNPLYRLNPSMGVVLDDIPNNWVGAITADPFEGVYVSYGVHFGRVKRLDPESGLEIGDEFTGEEDDIPTLQRWVGKPFLSISVDVRAAAELLRMALTGTAGGS